MHYIPTGRCARLDVALTRETGCRWTADTALAERIIGLFKTEVIHLRGPRRGLKAVKLAALEWVDWFNRRRRLLKPIGDIPPQQKEAAYYEPSTGSARAA